MNERNIFNIEELSGQQIPAEIAEQLRVLGRVQFPIKPASTSAVSASAEEPSQDQLDGETTLSGVLGHVAVMEDLVEQLEDMIDQLTKDMNIPVAPGSAVADAVKTLGGDGSTIDRDIFDRAQAIADHAVIMTLGRDPFLDAMGVDGKLDGPYTNCDEITKQVSNLWNTADPTDPNPEAPILDASNKIAEDFEKSKNKMTIEILLMLWWNMLWPKFVVSLVIINPFRLIFAMPMDAIVCFFKDMKKTCNKARFTVKPKDCLEQYGPLNKMLNRLACRLICKIPKPLYKRYKPMIDATSIKIMKNGKLVPCDCKSLGDCPPKAPNNITASSDGKLGALADVLEGLLGEPHEPCVDDSEFTRGVTQDQLKGPGMPPNCLDAARIVLDAVISDTLTPADPAKRGITGSASISSILERQTNQLGAQ
jgi:hypothetical protein